MKLYDQLEVVPIYSTFLLFAWSALGMVLFNEYEYYDKLQVTAIFGSAALCLLGVKALTMKHQRDQNEEKEEKLLTTASSSSKSDDKKE